jgi:hypothetical protein
MTIKFDIDIVTGLYLHPTPHQVQADPGRPVHPPVMAYKYIGIVFIEQRDHIDRTEEANGENPEAALIFGPEDGMVTGI